MNSPRSLASGFVVACEQETYQGDHVFVTATPMPQTLCIGVSYQEYHMAQDLGLIMCICVSYQDYHMAQGFG